MGFPHCLSLMSHFSYPFHWSNVCMMNRTSSATENSINVNAEQKWLGEISAPWLDFISPLGWNYAGHCCCSLENNFALDELYLSYIQSKASKGFGIDHMPGKQEASPDLGGGQAGSWALQCGRWPWPTPERAPGGAGKDAPHQTVAHLSEDMCPAAPSSHGSQPRPHPAMGKDWEKNGPREKGEPRPTHRLKRGIRDAGSTQGHHCFPRPHPQQHAHLPATAGFSSVTHDY